MPFAEECRKATNEYLVTNKNIIIENIKALCEAAAASGESRIFYAASYNQQIIDALKEEGLTVINHNFYGNDGLSIYWGNPMAYDLQLKYKNELIGYGPNQLDAGINKVILTNVGERDVDEKITILPIKTKDRVMLSLDGVVYASILDVERIDSGQSIDIYIKIEKLTVKDELNGSFELAIVTDYIEA